MKYLKHMFAIMMLLMMLIIITPANTISAASSYYVIYTGLSLDSCSATSVTFSGTINHVLPSSYTAMSNYYIDDVPANTIEVAATGSGSLVSSVFTDSVTVAASSDTYTFRWDYIIKMPNGGLEAGTRLVFVCDNGTPVSVTFSTFDPNAVGNIVGNLNDGRVNPHPAAPVVVYFVHTSVFLFAVDPADGTNTVAIDENTQVNPFTGKSIRLTDLTGGWYQLSTAYADGKPYIIQWNVNTSELIVVAW